MKTTILKSVALSLGIGLLSLCAQASGGEPAARGTLEAALDTISVDEIKADIFFLASDELGGRDTVSPGQRIAARFIRSRLERLGIAPGAPTGYFYEYPLVSPRVKESDTWLRLKAGANEVEYTFGGDYWFTPGTPMDLLLDGEVLFGGECDKRGIEKLEVGGKWVLALDEGKLFGDVEKDLLARGALGLIVTTSEKYSKKPYGERFAPTLAAMRRGEVSWPRGDASGAPKPTLPVVFVSREALARAWPEAEKKDSALPKAGAKLDLQLSHKRAYLGDGGRVMAENVCGWIPGSDPVLKNEVILISAHYDHVGTSSRDGQIYNGADDNGSGTTGLLALAEALTVRGPLKRSVMLIWVSGEEKGLWGSQAWTEKPWLPDGATPLCDLNIDMIGRNAPDKLLITPTKARAEYNGLVRIAEACAPLEGFPELGSCDAYWGRSDHINFSKNLKIPVAFLFSDIHEDYHKPTDDPEKIDYDKIRRVARTVLRMIDGLQADKLDL